MSDDIVGEYHRERLIANHIFGHENGVSQPQGFMLDDKRDIGEVSGFGNLGQQYIFFAIR